jgi:hypothetical protein
MVCRNSARGCDGCVRGAGYTEHSFNSNIAPKPCTQSDSSTLPLPPPSGRLSTAVHYYISKYYRLRSALAPSSPKLMHALFNLSAFQIYFNVESCYRLSVSVVYACVSADHNTVRDQLRGNAKTVA